VTGRARRARLRRALPRRWPRVRGGWCYCAGADDLESCGRGRSLTSFCLGGPDPV